jgi:Flp pilus assembly protein TadD
MNPRMLIVLCLFGALGCASAKAAPSSVLAAPTGSPADMVAKLEEGNRLFSAKDYASAEQSYRHTITAYPASAEAHYNLAVTLDRIGNRAEAKKHYIDAANLAPGHKVIWDSPPFRETGLNYDINRKSFLDANPNAR